MIYFKYNKKNYNKKFMPNEKERPMNEINFCPIFKIIIIIKIHIKKSKKN